ncbi:MAG: HAD-IA family hydrolase [Bacteroidales bacterium]
MISGILFNLDGTLINTLDLYKKVYQYVVQPYVRKPLTAEDIHGSKPAPEREFINRCVPEKEREQAFRRFLRHYSNFHDSHFGGMYEGVREMLNHLRKQNYLIGIVTGKSREAWKITSGKCALGAFDIIITDDDVDAYKPSLEGLQMALNGLKLENAETLYVGDHLNDFRMAREAGAIFAAALWSKTAEDRADFKKELEGKKDVWFLYHPQELTQKLEH